MKTSYIKSAFVIALMALGACSSSSPSPSTSGAVTSVNELKLGEPMLIQGQVLEVSGNHALIADSTAKISVNMTVALGKATNPLKKGDIVRAKGFPQANGEFAAVAVGRSDGLVIENGKVTSAPKKAKGKAK